MKDKGLVEYDDGIITYSLSVPAMNGIGIALDKKAALAKKQGKLFDIAAKRGFDFLATPLSCLNLKKEAEKDNELLMKYLSTVYFIHKENLKKWNFTIAYRNPKTNWALIKFEQKKSD